MDSAQINPNLDEKVNAADLPPTTENAEAPMPGDLPSYANYMGKFAKAVYKIFIK